jgi:uncharacterized damage-inducible protein DinB
MKKSIFLLLTVCGSVISAHAQMADTVKAYLVRDFKRAKMYTQEYLNAMPTDKYTYRPHDSVRTFAQQWLHISEANFDIASLASGIPSPRRNLETAVPQVKDSIVAVVNASYDFIIDALIKTDPATLLAEAKIGNLGFSKLAWFNKAFEHQGHHRGQTTIYIRMLGIKPPPERLF